MKSCLKKCLLVVAIGSGLLGCGGSEEVATTESQRAVYVDIKTLQAVVGDVVKEPPAVNPATGQRTLMPALYCPKCLRCTRSLRSIRSIGHPTQPSVARPVQR